MDSAAELARIINSQISKAMRYQSDRTFYRGIVTAVFNNKADVQIEGNPIAIPKIICLASYTPVVDDQVIVVSIGTSGANMFILGAVNTPEYRPLPTSINFNDDKYLYPGKWVIGSTANVTASTNAPTGDARAAGRLEVWNLAGSPPLAGVEHRYATQEWTAYTGAKAIRTISTNASGVQSFGTWRIY